jgi:cysteine synthase
MYFGVSHSIYHVGTGGTIAGTGRFIKSMSEDVLVVLADPEGSGLYNKVHIIISPQSSYA